MENLTLTKKENAANYDLILRIENLRKKLSPDSRPYHGVVMIKDDENQDKWLYVSNGYYMLKTRIYFHLEPGTYRIIKEKNQVTILPHLADYPDISWLEKSCSEYQETKSFDRHSSDKYENTTHAYCQIVREYPNDINYELFAPVFQFNPFLYYKLCKDEGRAIVLIDSESETSAIAWIMPLAN